MDLGEIDAPGFRQRRPEYVLAADHHDLIGPGPCRRGTRHVERLFEAVCHHHAVRDKATVAGQHDVETPVEDTRQGLKGPRPMMTGLPMVTLRK